MITVYTSSGAVYKFPRATRYKWGDKTIKLYDGREKIGNFVAANMDCVVDDGVKVVKEEANSN